MPCLHPSIEPCFDPPGSPSDDVMVPVRKWRGRDLYARKSIADGYDRHGWTLTDPSESHLLYDADDLNGLGYGPDALGVWRRGLPPGPPAAPLEPLPPRRCA